MKIYFIWAVILLFNFHAYSQPDKKIFNVTADNDMLFVGEDLTYIVKYAFLNLGEVRFKVAEKTIINSKTVYKTIAYIDSYPDVPFVSLHQVYESYIDSSLYPLKFIAKLFNEDTVFVEYDFIGDSVIQMYKGKFDGSNLWLDSISYTNQRMQDGLSILFYTRLNFGRETTISIPCFVNEKEESTVLNYSTEAEPISIEAIDYDINCRYLNGYTDFVSVYGLTGNFEGWFSNDSLAVPIRAKMNVILGSVSIELIKWNEAIWNPPLYKD